MNTVKQNEINGCQNAFKPINICSIILIISSVVLFILLIWTVYNNYSAAKMAEPNIPTTSALNLSSSSASSDAAKKNSNLMSIGSLLLSIVVCIVGVYNFIAINKIVTVCVTN